MNDKMLAALFLGPVAAGVLYAVLKRGNWLEWVALAAVGYGGYRWWTG